MACGDVCVCNSLTPSRSVFLPLLLSQQVEGASSSSKGTAADRQEARGRLEALEEEVRDMQLEVQVRQDMVGQGEAVLLSICCVRLVCRCAHHPTLPPPSLFLLCLPFSLCLSHLWLSICLFVCLSPCLSVSTAFRTYHTSDCACAVPVPDLCPAPGHPVRHAQQEDRRREVSPHLASQHQEPRRRHPHCHHYYHHRAGR